MSSITNRSATKKFILAMFQKLRPGMPIERVSAEALDILETRYRAMIIYEIKLHPSIGKTFRIG